MFPGCFILNAVKFVLSVSLLCLSMTIFAQSNTQLYPELSQKFKNYEIVSLDSKSIYDRVNNGQDLDHFIIQLSNGGKWDLSLSPSDIIGSDYNIVVIDEKGRRAQYGTKARPMIGKINGIANSEVALTFNENFVYGFIRIGFDEYYIEPVYHLSNNRSNDQFVLYSIKDIIQTNLYTCGYEIDAKELQKMKDRKKDVIGSRMPGGCYNIRYNTASDWSMRVKYGSVTGVENHNIGVLNNVQTNYDNEFADEIKFVMTQQYVTSCSTCDPWTTSTDAETLLISFTNWAPSGFSSTHDLAGLWTNRDLDGGTVGIAWLGVLCTNSKYHVLQDFTSNATSLRVMTSHEIGHNFNADHDASGSPFIMAPSVNSSTTWSSASISAIQGEYLSAGCLTTCSTGGSAPTANFTYNVNSFCTPGQVQYFDISTNVSSRVWTFPGGSPSSSTAQNPVVNYNNTGTYSATLQVTNSFGSNTLTQSNIVTVIANPVSNFTTSIVGNVVTFTYTGTGAQSFFWQFGDGTTSGQQNPVHTYTNDGVYTATLTIDNDCGSNSKSSTFTIITPPVANFSASTNAGCQPLTVLFTNQSSTNATTYLWTFPGGTPSTSNQQSPTVIYNGSGSFDVTLKVTNALGSNTKTETNYITVQPLAVPNFTFVQNGPSTSFTNISQYSTSNVWNFGDGTTSTALNPTHTYLENGTFTVTLNATNACGTISTTKQVIVAVAPVAAFSPILNANICTSQSVSFQNLSSYSPTSYSWIFEGGTPASSTEPNPIVTYNSGGTFDVQLIVANAFGSDTLTMVDHVTVNTFPVPTFTYINDGLSVGFSGLITNGSNPVWDFGDGQSSTTLNPTHLYTTEGTYTVTLSGQNGCGTIISTQTVLVQLTPTANFSANVTVACNPASITYTSNSSPSVTNWAWVFEGGSPATSTLANPLVTYDTPGTYNVSLTVSNSAGQNTLALSDYISIITVPTTGFQSVVDSNSITIINTGLDATSTSYNVYGPSDTLQLSGSPTTFAATSNGTYNIIQTNTNQCGQTVSNAFTVTITAFPVSSFTANGGGVLCVNSPVLFNNTSTNASTSKWEFVGGNPTSSTERNPSVVYSAAGSYVVKLITTNNLGVDSILSTINVGNTPTAAYNYTLSASNVTFQNLSSNSTSVKWEFGDGTVSTESNPSHTYAVSGTYSVKLISTNACGVDSISQTFSIIGSSSKDQEWGHNVLIMPNPTNGVFKIQIQDAEVNTYKVSIFDIFGRRLFSQSILPINGAINEDIDMSFLPSASYLLKLESTKGVITKQLIIQK